MYDYPAQVLAVVDGDTLDILADKGMEAKQWLVHLLTNLDGTFKDIYVFTVKDKKEKYGRYLGEFWIWGEDISNISSVNDRMVEAGHANYKTY